MKKQFDVNHLTIDTRLQQAILATFQRRAFAFLIDSVIIILASEFFALLLLLVLPICCSENALGILSGKGRN